QGEQEVLQRRVLVCSTTGVGDGPQQRRFKRGGKRKVDSSKRRGKRKTASSGRSLRRRSVIAGASRLRPDRGGEGVPVSHAECLGDEFQALAYGDLETLGGE